MIQPGNGKTAGKAYGGWRWFRQCYAARGWRALIVVLAFASQASATNPWPDHQWLTQPQAAVLAAPEEQLEDVQAQ